MPTIWQGLLAELAAKPRDVSSLGPVTIGGSACPPALMEAFDELRHARLPRLGHDGDLPARHHRPPAGRAVSAEEEWPYRVTQGRFPASVEARLIGPGGELLPWDGESAGELEVRGPWIAGAYYGGADGEPLRPEDKFSPDGWLRTGDVGIITPDGYPHPHRPGQGRHQVRRRVDLLASSWRTHLMAHPDVAEAAVVAVPDDKWGERPLATVVLKEGATADYEALRAFLAERASRAGSCRSAGRSSRRCRRRASASSTRR